LSNNGGLILLIFAVVIVTSIIIRLRKAIKGTKVNPKRTIVFLAYLVAISLFLVYNSFSIDNVPGKYVIPDLVVIMIAAYCSYIFSKRTLSFWKSRDSNNASSDIYVKGGLSIYFLYVAALTIRVAISFLFIGSQKFYFNNQQLISGSNTTNTIIVPFFHTGPATTILAFALTDILVLMGVGLIIGRSTMILKYFQQSKRRT
jgi:hypothetical protein